MPAGKSPRSRSTSYEPTCRAVGICPSCHLDRKRCTGALIGNRTIFHNGKIATNSRPCFAEAIAVKDGRISAVGLDSDVLRLKVPKTRLADLQRQTVIPGFNDSHLHSMRDGLGIFPRLAELALLAFIASATFVAHVFWPSPGKPKIRAQLGNFLKNVTTWGRCS
jgi:hypothetical protein